MTDWTELLEKHADMMKCKPVSEEGCGMVLHKDNFPIEYKYNDVGKRKRRRSSWCGPCRSKRQIARNAANKNKIKHTGPTGAWRTFLCEIPLTPMSKELREAR